MSSSAEHPDAMSPDAMAARIAALQAELAAKEAEHAAKVAALEESLTDLAHENALLKRRLFGSKTERLQTSELWRELEVTILRPVRQDAQDLVEVHKRIQPNFGSRRRSRSFAVTNASMSSRWSRL